MAHKFEIRRVKPDDMESLTSLYKDVYGATFSDRYWDWKYFRNPFGENMMYVALDKERVVGQVGTIPVKVKCSGAVYLSSQTCDITILPEYQKGGPFLKLYKLSNTENTNRNSLLCYGFSVPVTLRISSKLLKFRPLCPVWRWVLVLNPAPYLAKKLGMQFLDTLLEKPGRILVKLRLGSHLKKRGNSIIELNRFDERFDNFWEERKNDYGIMVVRDSGYLNWRYSDHPKARYKFFACVEEGIIKGFTVLSIVEDEVRRGLVMELMAPPGEKRIFDSLLSAAMDYFSRMRADVVTLWLPEKNPQVEIVEAWGFRRKETQHHFILKMFNPEVHGELLDYIMSAENWYFSMGDSDYH